MYIDSEVEGTGGPGRMFVDPDKLMQLKKGIEEELVRVRDWLEAHAETLRNIEPPGTDPCSRDTMAIMGQTGQTAIDKGDAYVARLRALAEKLRESAVAYGITEDHNTATFRRAPR